MYILFGFFSIRLFVTLTRRKYAISTFLPACLSERLWGLMIGAESKKEKPRPAESLNGVFTVAESVIDVINEPT